MTSVAQASERIAATTTRLDWPDVAKGLSIAGVVLLHACLVVPGGMDTKLAVANEYLAPLRMPLFFLVSGYFSAKIMRYSFVELVTKRLWFFLVPLLVWTPLELKARFVVWEMYLDKPQPPLEAYVEAMLDSAIMYWFLTALILFSIYLWATAKLPRWVALALAFAPLLLLMQPETSPLDYQVMGYLPFFMIGAVLRPAITWFAGVCTAYRYLIPAVGLFVGGHMWMKWNAAQSRSDIVLPQLGWVIEADDVHTVLQLVVRIVMLPAAITFALLLSKFSPTRAALSFLGRHTLVIYLGHAFGVSLLFEIILFDGEKPFRPDATSVFTSPTAGVLLCVVCCAVASVGFHFLAKLPLVGWTIFPPKIATKSPST